MRLLVPLHGLRIHPHLPVPDRHGEAAHVVGKRIEGASAGQVKPGVVPVARQDAVLHAAPVQRKPHVRTAVVHGVHLPVVVDDGDGVPAAGDHPAPGGSQFVNAAGPDLLRYLCRHDALLKSLVNAL